MELCRICLANDFQLFQVQLERLSVLALIEIHKGSVVVSQRLFFDCSVSAKVEQNAAFSLSTLEVAVVFGISASSTKAVVVVGHNKDKGDIRNYGTGVVTKDTVV
mmetsp:Transcript_5024/g.14072  ORF Transcript_5024/g.14072 Transcript_5024/m.14072 type:complete len:105 (-) Transcript_5024:475-789(-)